MERIGTNVFHQNIDFSDIDAINMIKDTSRMAAEQNASKLSASGTGAVGSNILTNDVEFWNWMARNYQNSGIFDSATSMQNYVSKGINQETWAEKVVQGKGYEWDWMKTQRGDFRKIWNTYDAGDVANRVGSDVTEKGLFSGNTTDYQMKAYTSNNKPHLDNTPKDMKVVTNKEQVDAVRSQGYENVDSFQDKETIKRTTQKRIDQMKSGKASPTYTVKNVGATMAKAGLIGCVIGMGFEAMVSYKRWQNGELSDDEYFRDILKAGGDAGITGGLTAGIMLPISKAVCVAGMTTWITIPVAIVVGGAVNKVIAPCFGRGEYRTLLAEMKYYQNLENIYNDLTSSMEQASNSYMEFIHKINLQQNMHDAMKKKSMDMNGDLKNLYDSI